ncbi:hypothetical protein FNV43_RR04562 [Rhamnella rubrinervis]|uniref:Uncharacterized protein n=1 Tax=Rhamnella rubrinervis TaxID=2594499 RepID=A0A8K0MQQ3_9ROSA|nr:hypothetical protein FNV43_RR04562 [Rhamnella rubrinervis]
MGSQGRAIITWFGEGLARTLEPGNELVEMARNGFPWLECGKSRGGFQKESSLRSKCWILSHISLTKLGRAPIMTCLKSGRLRFQALILMDKAHAGARQEI